MRRTDGLSNFVKEMKHIQSNISVNKVYTFCFWGISRFLDVAQWKICGTGFPMSFNELCGGPPVYLAVYELLPAADSEHRHLMSRKRYCCRYALWTQACPPSADALEPLVGRVNAEEASHHSRAPWWDFSSLAAVLQHETWSRSTPCVLEEEFSFLASGKLDAARQASLECLLVAPFVCHSPRSQERMMWTSMDVLVSSTSEVNSTVRCHLLSVVFSTFSFFVGFRLIPQPSRRPCANRVPPCC